MRPICPACTNHRPVAVNCYKNGKTYYRKMCDSCIRAGKKLKPTPPGWYKAGYRKKPHCEKCGFEAELPEKQLAVVHVNGDMRNNDKLNLRTVCLNCLPMVAKSRLPWKVAAPVLGF